MKPQILQSKWHLALILFVASLTACNNSGKGTAGSNDSTSNKPAHAEAIISGTKPDTTVSGTIKFDQDDKEVKMKLELSIPSKANQSVAVHIHDHGECGNMGKDAMGHWNPTNKQHGKWGSDSFHSGDIGNVDLDAKGNGSMELKTDLWSIGGDAKTNILDKSIIIHSGVDDYKTQPTGNAGERIGCGVIRKVQ